jgi:nucleoside-diphosphate-sugar epimerase
MGMSLVDDASGEAIRMRVLFIGGTGLISSACAELAVQRGIDLWLLNRGTSDRYASPPGSHRLTGDVHGPEADIRDLLAGLTFDAVVDWVAFTPDDVERDIRLFSGRTGQFVFMSSASAYQTPPRRYLLTEDTPLENPFWEYSRDKIACERRLLDEHARNGFPVTIVRPSHTYGPSQIPLVLNSGLHPWTAAARMRQGRETIVHGDGSSLWVLTWNADLAVALVGLLGRAAAIGEAFHITSDEVLTWDAITLEVGRALGVTPAIVHVPSDLIARVAPESAGSLLGDKSHSVVFDNSRIKRLIPEFGCRVPFAEGIRRTIAWFEADPRRRSIDETADRAWDAILDRYRLAFPGA